MDEEQNDFQGSTAQIPPPVIPKPIPEPEIPKTLPKSTPIPEPEILKTVPKANIPYPSRRDNQKNREKASYQKKRFFVDFEANPRVPLILRRSFLKTDRTLIDVYEGEITLHVDNEAVTFNLDQTMKYSSTNDKSINQINIIDEICEEYVPEFDHDDCDPEEDIYVLEQLLNDDPFQLPPMDLKQSEVTEAKSSIEEPPELELKDLPSHLEYAFLEENDKLPVIIEKECQLKCPNRGLKRILERMVGENRASWSDKLDDALWAFQTAFKTPIGCTHYQLVYGKSCHLPVELEHKAYWTLKHVNFDLQTAGDHRKLQLNELNELRDHAYENSLIYKEKTKKLHDSKIKNRIFNVGDQVLLFNSRLKIFSKKLKTRWSGPFTIAQVFPYRIVELSQPDGPNFKVNGHRMKHYFGGDIPPKVVPDLHTLPKEN
ncbi:reverse transcriptase domain-containing protein [Tanacetum coccineum]|uniref:Reverse transcriptase domain-containing protein n=1 Tax=Tanacetum coccineum TaxID=301880 RepID=A0ABQ5CAE5_9ASTR